MANISDFKRDFYEALYRKALIRRGQRPFKAKFDTAGLCIYCGEGKRCPGWHRPEETERRRGEGIAYLI